MLYGTGVNAIWFRGQDMGAIKVWGLRGDMIDVWGEIEYGNI